MPNNYREYLENEYNKALKEFEDAKIESIKKLDNITAAFAEDYGAGYAARIDKVSIAAAKVQMLNRMITAYNHFEG